ncbi:hypothetical protein V5P93_004261 [Actinokineospora auranticolor]|uniref:Uncharacterized protein n=1 Tax=Actinokineospora auranticolor TaxID=155976 RepID=A0A2S6GID8_9PSEU|nr:hypothetical protein [Actinokineospora auranticolor]PPK64994.1 hypothetical protein CLV40_11636 [Actinokineospora auranticolor]
MVRSDASALSALRFDTRVQVHGTSEFTGVLAVSADEVWAVGGAADPATGRTVALVGRWTQDFRFVAPAPAAAAARLIGVDGVGDDVWAVGWISDGRGGGKPRIERYSRSSGAVEALDGPSVDGNSSLNAVAMLSTTEGWAVGASGPSADADPTHTLIARWDGTAWRAISSPSPGSALNRLDAVSARTTDDVWAVGSRGDGERVEALITRWDGTTWTRVPFPGDGIELHDVAAVDHDSVWVVGTNVTPGKSDTHVGIARHWDGSKWTDIAPTPSGITELTGIAVVAPDDVWFAGYAELPGLPDTAHLAHWDGTRWRDEAPVATTNGNVASALHRICVGGTRVTAVGWHAASTDPAARTAAALLGRATNRPR